MNARDAKRRAYGIAAMALRRAIETEMVNDDNLSVEDAGKIYIACATLKDQLVRRTTNDFEKRAAYR